MTIKGAFEIEGDFKLTGRGLVIYGDLASGTIGKDNFICLNIGQNEFKLKIKCVDFIDRISEKVAKIGLTFDDSCEEQLKQLQTMHIAKQTAIIYEQ